MRQGLRSRPQGEGIAAHHPGAVSGKVSPPDGGKTEADEEDHRRARQKPDAIEEWSITIDGRIELGQPEA